MYACYNKTQRDKTNAMGLIPTIIDLVFAPVYDYWNQVEQTDTEVSEIRYEPFLMTLCHHDI